MTDQTAAAKPARGKTAAAGAKLAEQMAGIVQHPAAEPEATAERAERSRRAATTRRRNAPATTARTVRAAPMPATQTRPQPVYSERISHTTTPDQLDALTEVSRQARRATGQAVPLTALLRAAAQICLDDARLRERMARLARTEWR
jgi:hypothetical protein